MSLYFDYDFRLTGMDVDAAGQCKPSALLDHLQIAAALAAEDGGFDRDRLLNQYGGFWMLSRSWLRLDRPLGYADRLTVRTWHRGGRAALMYRDYDIYAGGTLVGESVSAWVLADFRTRKIIRLSSVPELQGTGGGDLCKSLTLGKLRAPAQLREVERRPMRWSDADCNGHVNNTRYADFACDALDMAALEQGGFLSTIQIGYLAECRPGEALTIQTGEQDGTRYVRGVDAAGKARFEAALVFGETPD